MEKIDYESFPVVGIFFNKALPATNLTPEEAELSLRFCRLIKGFEQTAPVKYQKNLSFIYNELVRANVPEDDARNFIMEYIGNSVYPTGEIRDVCISENFTDIGVYRKILPVFYHKVIPASVKNCGERNNTVGKCS